MKHHQAIRKFVAGILMVFLSGGISSQLHAQNQCVFSLQRAERLYQQGLIEEIPGLLIPCIKSGFNRDERMTAYKLLIQSLLYDDQTEEADKYMQEFLARFPEYQITPADQAEFAFLFNTYHTVPVYSLGVILGGGLVFPSMLEQYGTYSILDNDPEYKSSSMRLKMGLTFSKYLGVKTDLNLDLVFQQMEYKYSVSPDFFTDFARTHFKETISMIAFPLSVTYKLGFGRLQPYFRGGISPAIYLGSAIDPKRDYTEGTFDQVSGQDLLLGGTGKRNTLLLNALVGAGLKYKIPYAGSLLLDLRFEPGIRSIVADDQRYSPNSEALWRYYILDDDVLLHNLSISVGWVYPIYKSTKQP